MSPGTLYYLLLMLCALIFFVGIFAIVRLATNRDYHIKNSRSDVFFTVGVFFLSFILFFALSPVIKNSAKTADAAIVKSGVDASLSNLGALINASNDYYDKYKTYGSLDDVSVFASNPSLAQSGIDYAVAKIPTGALLHQAIYESGSAALFDSPYARANAYSYNLDVSLNKGRITGVSCSSTDQAYIISCNKLKRKILKLSNN